MRYFLISGHRKGRGIHSPSVFSFVSEAIFNQRNWSPTEALVSAHRSILKNRSQLAIDDFGAGSQVNSSEVRRVNSMVRWSSVNRKTGRLLYRISRWYKPATIIELGTGLGISTSYLAEGSPEAEVISIEGSEKKSIFAREYINKLGIHNTNILTGKFDEILPGLLKRGSERVLIFLDGNHRFEPTMEYLNQILKWESKEVMIVMDDIHWSEGMEIAWARIRARNEIRVSLDLFFTGVLFLREDLGKEHFDIRF